jgi:hypothetical protein
VPEVPEVEAPEVSGVEASEAAAPHVDSETRADDDAEAPRQ